MRMTLRTSTPATPASGGFSETARMARPISGARQQQMHGDDQQGRDAKREKLVGRGADAAAERHGDLQRPGEIKRLRG